MWKPKIKELKELGFKLNKKLDRFDRYIDDWLSILYYRDRNYFYLHFDYHSVGRHVYISDKRDMETLIKFFTTD